MKRKSFLSLLLAAGMVLGLTGSNILTIRAEEEINVLDSGDVITEGSSDSEIKPEVIRDPRFYVVRENGEYKDVSEIVLKEIEEKTVYYDEKTGYLFDYKTDELVDPKDGLRYKAEEENVDITDKGEKPVFETEGTNASPEISTEKQPVSEVPPQVEGPVDLTETLTESEKEANEELIKRQNIVTLPEEEKNYRFYQIDPEYRFVKVKEAFVFEEKNTDSKKVGSLIRGNTCCILEDMNDGWYYIESGNVRGFVLIEALGSKEAADEKIESYKKLAAMAQKGRQISFDYRDYMHYGSLLVPFCQNAAYTYLMATTEEVVIQKSYAVTIAKEADVMDCASLKGMPIGKLTEGDIMYVIADRFSEWVYIESGAVRGFVRADAIKMGWNVSLTIKNTGEENYGTAAALTTVEENRAFYLHKQSVEEGDRNTALRHDILTEAAKYVGNPYVWGGTSLTEGADCSGYVQSIFAEFGIYLPRVSAEQSVCGTQIRPEDARQGDLIFYAKNGAICHVVIYAGEGTTLEAWGTELGIIQGTVDYDKAAWAVRVIE